jgi:hypothetical protein
MNWGSLRFARPDWVANGAAFRSKPRGVAKRLDDERSAPVVLGLPRSPQLRIGTPRIAYDWRIGTTFSMLREWMAHEF